MNIYVVIVILCGIASLILQWSSHMTMGWSQISTGVDIKTPQFDVHTQHTTIIKVGLVQTEVCRKIIVNSTMTKKRCGMFSVTELKTLGFLSAKMHQALTKGFAILPILSLKAVYSSTLGLAAFLFQFSSCCSKAKVPVQVVSMMFWLIAAILLATTVGIGVHSNSNLSHLASSTKKDVWLYSNTPLEASVNFPYSVLLSGLGMALCFVNTAAIIIDILVTKSKRSTDYWQYERIRLTDDHESVELMNENE